MQNLKENLVPFLSDHFQAEITKVESTGLGEWSQTFFFTAGQQRKVIRFSAYDEDFKKDRFAARYASPKLPIPPIEEIGEAFGLFYAVSPRIDGKMIEHLSTAEARKAVPALMDLLNALREVDGSETVGYGGFGADGNALETSWEGYLTNMTADSPESRLRGWKEKLARNKVADNLYQMARQRLLELIPICPDERHLIHNDLLHYNLLIQNDRVAGLIDWGCAMWGDFLYDLAMFIAWQFYYPSMAGIDFAAEAHQFFTRKGVVLPYFMERLECYQLHLLLDSLAYNAWKEDAENMAITARRLKQVLEHSGHPV